ncbi:MAG: hypothetical protein N2381_04530 [Armatimonadetes bacterium]|nr:hypothetical protein [Armatimonadota bacterium]
MSWFNHRAHFRKIVAALFAASVYGAAYASVLIDDFEREPLEWECRDATRRDGASLCAIWAVSPGCPQSPGNSAALITFFAAKDSWASVSKRIDGGRLQKEGVEGISLWFCGDGSDSSVTLSLVLRKRLGATSRYTFKLPLSFPRWQWIAIPFSEFQGAGSAIGRGDVGSIVAVEFRMDGSWDSAFMLVDDIQAYVGRKKLQAPEPAEPSEFEAKPVHIFVEPENIIGSVRARVGTCLDGDALKLLSDTTAVERAKQLQLGIGRIKTTDLLAWSDAAGKYELSYDTLEQLLKLAKALHMQPMIAVVPISPEQLASDEFVRLAVELTRRYGFRDDVTAIEVNYCHAYALSATPQRAFERLSQIAKTMAKVRPRCAIGGIGLLAPWYDLTMHLLRLVRPLDFFSFQFFGTHNASTTTEALMAAALKGMAADLPDQIPLSSLRALVKQRWGELSGLYISEANLNSIRTDAGGARDERICRPEGMAWWMAFLQTASASVDEVVQFKLCGDGWGLLSDELMPTPSYWAVWIFNIFSPRGSGICKLTNDDASISCIGVRTPTAVNVLIANTSDKPRQVEIRVSQAFASKVSMIRVRRVLPTGDNVSRPTYELLRPQDSAKVKLPGYAISVVQFVPAG